MTQPHHTYPTLCAWFLAFMLAPATAHAKGPKPFPFANEELTYKIQFKGSEAVRAKIRVGHVRRTKNLSYVPVSANAQSVGFFHSIYPMDDRANTFIDPETMFPLRSEKLFRERGKERIYKVDYARSLYKAKVDKRSKKGKRKFSKAIPGTTHTALSWLMHLRTRTDLKQGAKFSYYVFDGWKLSRLDIQVLGQAEVYTPMGWFHTWKMEFSRELLRAKAKRKGKRYIEPALFVHKPAKKTGYVWLSQDLHRLPVKISMTSLYGVGKVVLVGFKSKGKSIHMPKTKAKAP